jgi:predicted nucleic acid-binding protein
MLKISPGMRAALAQQRIREQLQVGVDAADRGEVVPFDAAAIKAAGRARVFLARAAESRCRAKDERPLE